MGNCQQIKIKHNKPNVENKMRTIQMETWDNT